MDVRVCDVVVRVKKNTCKRARSTYPNSARNHASRRKINHLLRVQTPSEMFMGSIVLVGTAVGRGRDALQGYVGVVCVDVGGSFSMLGRG